MLIRVFFFGGLSVECSLIRVLLLPLFTSAFTSWFAGAFDFIYEYFKSCLLAAVGFSSYCSLVSVRFALRLRV